MSGFVYFIACFPLDAVKIGFTSVDPKARLKALQTGCPAPLKMLFSVPASMEEEQKLHQAFYPLHIQGEWFRWEGKLRHLAVYLTDCDGKYPPSRESFVNALHDVLMQGGLWHPSDPMGYDEYLATGDWQPFRQLLWASHGPWEEE